MGRFHCSRRPRRSSRRPRCSNPLVRAAAARRTDHNRVRPRGRSRRRARRSRRLPCRVGRHSRTSARPACRTRRHRRGPPRGRPPRRRRARPPPRVWAEPGRPPPGGAPPPPGGGGPGAPGGGAPGAPPPPPGGAPPSCPPPALPALDPPPALCARPVRPQPVASSAAATTDAQFVATESFARIAPRHRRVCARPGGPAMLLALIGTQSPEHSEHAPESTRSGTGRVDGKGAAPPSARAVALNRRPMALYLRRRRREENELVACAMRKRSAARVTTMNRTPNRDPEQAPEGVLRVVALLPGDEG